MKQNSLPLFESSGKSFVARRKTEGCSESSSVPTAFHPDAVPVWGKGVGFLRGLPKSTAMTKEWDMVQNHNIKMFDLES